MLNFCSLIRECKHDTFYNFNERTRVYIELVYLLNNG